MSVAWITVRRLASDAEASVTSPPRLPPDMIAPRLAVDITEPHLAAESKDAALDALPTLSTDAAEPMDRTLPTEAMLSPEPRLAMVRNEFSDAIAHFDTVILESRG